MTGLADEFRTRAKQQIDASNVLLDKADFGEDSKKQALAIIGQVNATVLNGLADLMDYQAREHLLGGIFESAQRNIKRNDAIRKAAAKGDWNEFDRLAAGGDPAVEPAVVGGTVGPSGTP